MAVKTITIVNKKGGVGKTTTAVTLAHGLSLSRKKVLVVDTDPQGHVAPSLGLQQEPGLFNLLVGAWGLGDAIRQARNNLWILPSNPRTATAESMLIYEKAKYSALRDALKGDVLNLVNDYIIIDTAPSGVAFLQQSALWCADLVLVPTACDYLSSAGIMDLMDTLGEIKRQGWKGKILGILPTFYDEVTKETDTNFKQLQSAFGHMVLGPIHRATVLRECTAEGKTIFEVDPKSRAAREYALLARKVLSV